MDFTIRAISNVKGIKRYVYVTTPNNNFGRHNSFFIQKTFPNLTFKPYVSRNINSRYLVEDIFEMAKKW